MGGSLFIFGTLVPSGSLPFLVHSLLMARSLFLILSVCSATLFLQGAIALFGSLTSVGTLSLGGSLLFVGTLPYVDSLILVGTLSLSDSLNLWYFPAYGSLPQYGTLRLYGSLPCLDTIIKSSGLRTLQLILPV